MDPLEDKIRQLCNSSGKTNSEIAEILDLLLTEYNMLAADGEE